MPDQPRPTAAPDAMGEEATVLVPWGFDDDDDDPESDFDGEIDPSCVLCGGEGGWWQDGWTRWVECGDCWPDEEDD